MAKRSSVSIRFTGASLQPQEVTQLVGAIPTLAYQKGETFHAGKTRKDRVGLTGLWLLNLAEKFDIHDIIKQSEHCLYLLTDNNRFNVNTPKAEAVRRFLALGDIKLHVSLYWYGEYGENMPRIDDKFCAAVEDLGGELQIDFDQDTEEDLLNNTYAMV